jgi:hypothetical protein
MSRAGIAQAIAELDALSRRRPLTYRESWRLSKLLTTERRYDQAQRVNRTRRDAQAGTPSPARPFGSRPGAAAATPAIQRASVNGLGLRGSEHSPMDGNAPTHRENDHV